MCGGGGGGGGGECIICQAFTQLVYCANYRPVHIIDQTENGQKCAMSELLVTGT